MRIQALAGSIIMVLLLTLPLACGSLDTDEQINDRIVKDNVLGRRSFIGPGQSIMELRDHGNYFVIELFVPGRSPQQVQLTSLSEGRYSNNGFELVKQGTGWILRDNLGSTRVFYPAFRYAGILSDHAEYPTGEVLLFLAQTEEGHQFLLTPKVLSSPEARSSGLYYILKGRDADGNKTDRTVYELFEERTNQTLMCLEVIGSDLVRIGQNCNVDIQSGETFALSD